MIPAGRFADFAHWRSPKLTAPDHDGIFQQPALFQIANQRHAGLINVTADRRQVLFKILCGAAVMIPVRMIKLHEPHTAFSKSAGQQTITGEAGFSGIFDTVQIQSLFGFSCRIHQFRRTGLHSIGHLIGVDPCRDLAITGQSQSLSVQFSNRSEDIILLLGRNHARCGQIQNRLPLISQRHALIGRWQHSAAPQHGASARSARSALQHDESWQVRAFTTQSIGQP